MNPVQRSLTSLSIAAINLPHIAMWAEQGQDVSPFLKLLQKQKAFLTGELKSEANLLRFFEDFSTWRQNIDYDDSLSRQICELSCAALYSSVESLQDPECDDTLLLTGFIDQIYNDMDDMGAETGDLKGYWIDIQSELKTNLKPIKQRPVNRDFFKWLTSHDVSLFGLSE